MTRSFTATASIFDRVVVVTRSRPTRYDAQSELPRAHWSIAIAPSD